MSNSYTTINKMFFLSNNDSDILCELNKYMFTKSHHLLDIPPLEPYEENVIPIIKESINQAIKPVKNESIIKTKTETTILEEPTMDINTSNNIDFLSPTQQDTLFWCIYIAMHGYSDYQQVSRNYGVKELEIKQKIGNYIQTNPTKMKQTNMKITKAAVQEILSELLTSVRETSFFSMIGMMVYYKINILIVDATGKKMLDFVSDIDNELPTYVLHKDKFGKYKLQCEPITKQQVDELKTTIFCLESYLKPLKPISNYHVEDLYNIAKKIGIYNENKKYKKTDLYQELSEILSWK